MVLHGDSIIRTSGSIEKIGSSGDYSNIKSWQKHISDTWYTKLIPAVSEPRMELLRNAEFMRGAGLQNFQAGVPTLTVPAKIPTSFYSKNYFILFPDASVPAKQWPFHRFMEIADLIYRVTGWTCIICGGSKDPALRNAFSKYENQFIQNWIGRTTLLELVSLITKAHIVIGNDTSAIHIAVAVSTPSVCIAGGWHNERFVPYQVEVKTDRMLPLTVTKKMECFDCNWHCVKSTKQAAHCLEQVSVYDVWDKTQKLLKTSNFKKETI
jgi:ADP-heptose:LPS heptosyltransferase